MLLRDRASWELDNPPDLPPENIRMEFRVGEPGWLVPRTLSLEMVLSADGKACLASGYAGTHDYGLEDFKIVEGIRKAGEHRQDGMRPGSEAAAFLSAIT